MLLLDRESLALAVSKPSPLLPPCSHECQSEGTLQGIANQQAQSMAALGPHCYENPFFMGRGLAVGVEKWGLYGQLRLVHHADSAGPAGLRSAVWQSRFVRAPQRSGLMASTAN